MHNEIFHYRNISAEPSKNDEVPHTHSGVNKQHEYDRLTKVYNKF